MAKGVLTQRIGPWDRPDAYLSKKVDSVAACWPACMKAVATVALFVRDADKLTLGQDIVITAPHALESLVQQPPEHWLTKTRMTNYQRLLLNPDGIWCCIIA